MAIATIDKPIATENQTTARPKSTPPLIRVLHVINGEHYSGAERVQDLLAERLPDFGFEVGFACVKPERFPLMRKSQDTPLFEVPMKNQFDLTVVWRLTKIIRRGRYQVVHAHTPRAALVGRLAAMLAGVPFVYHVHSPTSRDSTQRLRNWLNSVVERISLCAASRLITVSQSLARHMQSEGYSAERISTVPNGVPEAECEDREAPQQTWTIGTVALFRPRKGIEVLIDAIAELRSRGIDVMLHAVGPFETPEYEREIKNRIARLGLADHVRWVGFTRDVNAELKKMDLFVLPSLFGEGLPMVVLEAMAAGVPVVGTDVEGVPEAIRDGIDGTLARAGDKSDLAAAMLRIISGELDWSVIRKNARARHAREFSDSSMACGVATAYRTVLKPHTA